VTVQAWELAYLLDVSVKCPGMNVFVAFFILLILLADNTPPASSTIPLIGKLAVKFLTPRLLLFTCMLVHCVS